MSDPVLRIKFENGDGKPLASSIEIRLLEGLSLGLCKKIVKEVTDKKMPASLDAALPALGIK